ncbi:MAG: hypothetical protein AAGJ70_03825 [Pseudomonadota bacterium]
MIASFSHFGEFASWEKANERNTSIFENDVSNFRCTAAAIVFVFELHSPPACLIASDRVNGTSQQTHKLLFLLLFYPALFHGCTLFRTRTGRLGLMSENDRYFLSSGFNNVHPLLGLLLVASRLGVSAIGEKTAYSFRLNSETATCVTGCGICYTSLSNNDGDAAPLSRRPAQNSQRSLS